MMEERRPATHPPDYDEICDAIMEACDMLNCQALQEGSRPPFDVRVTDRRGRLLAGFDIVDDPDGTVWIGLREVAKESDEAFIAPVTLTLIRRRGRIKQLLLDPQRTRRADGSTPARVILKEGNDT